MKERRSQNERARRGQARKRVKTVSNGQTEPDQGRSSPGVIFLDAQLWARHRARGRSPPRAPLGARSGHIPTARSL